MSKKKLGVACASVVLVGAMLFSVGCAQASNPAQETPNPETEQLYLPTVFADTDGDLIQITPNEDVDDVAFMKQRRLMPFNTYYMDADHRGCKSCHDDLRAVLDESPYEHVAINGLDVEWTVEMCLGCHANGTNGYFTVEHAFASEMHAIHRDTADCWNCHDTDTTWNGDNPTMYLWDSVSHDKLRGIDDIGADAMADTFAWSQDYITAQEDLYNLNEQYYDWDYIRMEKEEAGEPLDEEMRDNWTISVSGEVEKPMTFNLGELIKTAPMETRTMKWACMINPIGGPGLGQAEFTGIPLSYLTDQCGLKETATAIWPESIDGFVDPGAIELAKTAGGDALLAVEINGEPVSWENGYPCILVLGGPSCGCYVKQLSNINFVNADTSLYEIKGWPSLDNAEEGKDYIYYMDGWPNRDYTDSYDSPNAGIIGLKEGQIVKTGEKLTIEGYADCYSDQTVAVEISMDRGKTWKRFDTSSSDPMRFITWTYEFTPEEDAAYCIAVRAVDINGQVTEKPIEKMIVAHSDLDNFSPVSLTTVTQNAEEE